MGEKKIGAGLHDLAQNVGDGIFATALSTPIASVASARVRVSVRDVQGNITRIDRTFGVSATADGLFLDGFE